MKLVPNNSFFVIFLIFFLFDSKKAYATTFEEGKKIFITNCIACHKGGENLIIPEKNLKKNTLEANGMYSLNAIIYQVINGKNGMPAFGGRLLEEEIENVAFYVLNQSAFNFEEK